MATVLAMYMALMLANSINNLIALRVEDLDAFIYSNRTINSRSIYICVYNI